MRLSFQLHELGCYAHSVTGTSHSTLEDVVNSQFRFDLSWRFVAGLVVHRRGKSNDAQPSGLQPGELSNHLLGESVTEIVLLRIGVQISEGKHDQLYLPVFRSGLGQRLRNVRLPRVEP